MNTSDLPLLPAGYKTRWWGLLFICISLLVISLDNTILNVALPAISRDLSATSSDLQWIIDAYILVFAALLLTMGSISDRYGRKRWLQIGLVLFGIGSFLAAISTTTTMLIATRAFLGVGAAVIMPSTLSLVTATFPEKERSQAIALWAATFGMGVGLGPLIGGLLLERFEWGAVFLVNLPVIAVALVGGQFLLPESRDETAPKIDLPGVLLSITGLFALVYAIIKAGEDGWLAQEVIIAFAAAGVLLGVFALWESITQTPMLPLRFFKNLSFTGANTALAFIMFSMFGSVFFLSQYLQTVLGYSALESGVRLLPLSFTLAFTAAMSARVSRRIGVKYTVALGVLIAAGGLFYMSQAYEVGSSYGTILIGMLIMSSGLGMAVSPATDSVMGSVPQSKAGIGSAMNDTTRELGGAMGVAILGTLMNHQYIHGVEELPTKLAEINPLVASNFPSALYNAVEDSIQAAHGVAANLPASFPPTMPPEMGARIQQAVLDTANQAFVNGMTEAMFIGSLVMLSAVVITLILLPHRVQTPRETQAFAPAEVGAKPDAKAEAKAEPVVAGD